ncbi:phosphoribosylanthranilate isomerase [Desulfatitalea alkaliphila]|uniref:N-(5'-phosphoribosyl)anthranilate isomerase n=1 Tax=Desulfatitalea alkaliphila TaxID=2929485 RepID=A0AA41R626_9BACT|nr:phosphoribosylanthranilate isomerase [Desulfatitalea alkaliphila]MCJ8501551.1 phosphoribosylanthranilate isomerase [Desulfatitalea alkaliphila]
MTRVKICGIHREADLHLSVACGADALGFVVEYPMDVPWNLDRAAAETLMYATPPFVSRVIVVGDDPALVIALTKRLRPHAVQLHGNEPIAVTAEMVTAIHGLGVQVLKPLRFSVETGRCHAESADPFEAARQIEQAGVDALILDSVSDTRPAGTGQSVDWAVARQIRVRVRLPLILAGGLHAGNVGQAVAAVRPYGVDVISGVENSVGGKDPAKVKAFIQAVTQSRC